jgi:hypothetical protein
VTCLKCRPDEAIDPSLSHPTHSRTTQRRRKKGQEITAQDRERRPMTFNRTGRNCIGTRGGAGRSVGNPDVPFIVKRSIDRGVVPEGIESSSPGLWRRMVR